MSGFRKAINVALEDNLIRKPTEYRRRHNQMRYISKECFVTLAVLYGAQPVECFAEQEYLWLQVPKWYHYQPPLLHGRHQAICDCSMKKLFKMVACSLISCSSTDHHTIKNVTQTPKNNDVPKFPVPQMLPLLLLQ